MNLDKYEVNTLNEVVSQELAISCIKSMIKNTREAPKIIILSGPSGTGRKSIVKNYIKSIYCKERTKDYSNCGVCENCISILNNKEIYTELDYSEIDNIPNTKYILVKNFELCPRKAQEEFYRLWNELEYKPTIILITEHTDNLVSDIEDISLILRTSSLRESDILTKLQNYKLSFNSNIDDNTLNVISRRSSGSMTFAIRMFENYSTLDEETLQKTIESGREYFIALLISALRDDRANVDKSITKLRGIPLNYLKRDYESLILEILKVYIKIMKPKDSLIGALIKEAKTKVLDLYNILNDKIIYNSFTNDDTFQAAMYVIYLKLTEKLR